MPELTAEQKEVLKVMVGSPKTPCRGSYVKVFKAEMSDLSGQEEFSMQLLIPKSDTKTIGAIKEAMKMAIWKKWGDDKPAKLKIPLRDGDKDGAGGVPDSVEAGKEPYGGHYFMNVKNTRQPTVVDQKKRPILDFNEFVSGDYCRVSVNAFPFDKKSKGVSFGLNGIQLLKRGEPLGSSFNADEVFDEVEVADDMPQDDDDVMFE